MMITKCVRTDERLVFSYIGMNYPSCLYLYLDLLKYGIESESIDVYIQTADQGIKALLLKYYTCLHIYSRDNTFNVNELIEFFGENDYTMLYCKAETAERIYSRLPQELKEKATITKGWVAQIKQLDREPRRFAVAAEKKDFEQIVKLIYEDKDIGRSYRFDDLTKQLEERNHQGYARNLVIKQEDTIIAHACTNAEFDRIAVVAELLVRKEYRRKGFASEIWREICYQLLSEGKEVFSFYYSEESRALHKQIGFEEVCEWAKIVIS